MNKKLIILQILIILITMTTVINAQGIKVENIYAGIAYNQYSNIDLNDNSYFSGIDFKRVVIKGKPHILGAEVEVLDYTRKYSTAYTYLDEEDQIVFQETYQVTDKYKGIGVLGSFTYMFKQLKKDIDYQLYFKPGLYLVNIESKIKNEDEIKNETEKEWQIGTKMGIEIVKNLKENFKMGVRLGYRKVDKFSGLETGIFIKYNF